MLKAVIFDMDGVIIDSEPMHSKAAIMALKKFGVNISYEYLDQYIGSTITYMSKKMIEDFNIKATPDELIQVNYEMKELLLKEEGYPVIPYIIDLMKDLYSNGIKLMIASSSPAITIEAVMDSLNIKPYFEGYVSGLSVKNPKPAPDIFLEAAAQLKVKASECVVIEDSYNGARAAKAAGMACIGFINPNSGNQDLSSATMLVEGFDEVDYSFVKQVYQYAYLEPTEILRTEHFIIRELSEADIPAMFQIYQKADTRSFIDDISDSLEEETEKHRAYIQNVYHFYGFGLWGVFLKCNNCLIGRCGIELKMLDGQEIFELGYLLDSSYRGQGYAKEFVSAIIEYCFDKLHIRSLVAIIDKENISSIRLANSLGMENVGECIRNQRNCYRYVIASKAS